MQNFRYQVGDDAMVYFYLYLCDEVTGAIRQISERFSVFIHKQGYTGYLDKVNSNTCVFIDLGKQNACDFETKMTFHHPQNIL